MATENIERNHAIDLIKGVCIVFVIVTHAQWSTEERQVYLFPYWIDMAVPVFMIISGYVNSLSYQRKRISSFGDAYSLKNIFSSMIRYSIPVGITLLIELAFIVIYKETVDVIPFCLRGGDGPGSYYYPIMVQFIFVFPIIYFIIQKYDVCGFIICGFINCIYEILQTAYGMNVDCYRLLFFRYIFAASFGCFLVLKKGTVKKIYKILLFFIGFIFITAVGYWNYTPHTVSKWIGTSWIASMYIMPLFPFALKKLNKRCIFLEIMGKASFNIFLAQIVYYWRIV